MWQKQLDYRQQAQVFSSELSNTKCNPLQNCYYISIISDVNVAGQISYNTYCYYYYTTKQKPKFSNSQRENL